MAARMKFICDTERCIDCNGCVTACKDENDAYSKTGQRRSLKCLSCGSCEKSWQYQCWRLSAMPKERACSILESRQTVCPCPGKFIHGWLPISGRTTGPS